MFIWKKLGRVFVPNCNYPWMHCYASPVWAISLHDKIRVFFSTRSAPDSLGNYISRPAYVDVSKNDPTNVIGISSQPLLELGNAGFFDNFGIMIAKGIFFDGKIYLYYMGWQRLYGEVPYQVSVGLAVSHDFGNTFSKVSCGPVLPIDFIDPISIGNVDVRIDQGLWRMWYTSFTKWLFSGQKPTPSYEIKLAISTDGINWKKTDQVAIPEINNVGVATPSVFSRSGKYHMLYGYRDHNTLPDAIAGYSIGYAESLDLVSWTRKDTWAGLERSLSGWDSEMVCYPHICVVDSKVLVFYCGNNFGRDGFGVAELQGEN